MKLLVGPHKCASSRAALCYHNRAGNSLPRAPGTKLAEAHRITSLGTPRRLRSQLQQHQVRASGTDINAPHADADKYLEVEELKGVRVILEDDLPTVQYWVKWKDGSPDTWELPENLADDLIRTFEEQWWTAAKKGDTETLQKFLAGGREILSQVVDENRRSALHFAAGMGNAAATKLLIEAGANPDLQDKEGYTPLHMAAGYMQTGTMVELLAAGANPELKDSSGRTISTLVDNLKNQIPLQPQMIPRRLALEEVSNRLIESVYEEVDPSAVLDVRDLPDNGGRQFLVSFADGRGDEWLHESMLSGAVIKAWEAGEEFADVAELLAVERKGTARKFLVRWSDGYPDSWEPEESISEDLVRQFEEQHPELVKRKKGKGKKKAARQAMAGEAAGNGLGSGAPLVHSGNGNGNGSQNGAKQVVVERELTAA